MKKLLRVGFAGLIAGSLMTAAPAASANDRDVIRTGSCSGASDWKLKLSPEDGRIEVEFEVDQNVVGATWNVTLRHNGTAFFRGQRKTQPPSGSFEVEKLVRNLAGPDRISAKAVNPRTGETCRGSATF